MPDETPETDSSNMWLVELVPHIDEPEKGVDPIREMAASKSAAKDILSERLPDVYDDPVEAPSRVTFLETTDDHEYPVTVIEVDQAPDHAVVRATEKMVHHGSNPRGQADTGRSDPVLDYEPTRHDVIRVMEAVATEKQVCGVCRGSIDTTTSLQHDRECVQCGTKYTICGTDTESGNPEYQIDSRSTPTGRIRDRLRKEVGMKAVQGVLRSSGQVEEQDG